VKLPELLTERLPFLEGLEDDWERIPRAALAAWLIFYVVFLCQAMRGHGILLMIDLVFVPIHEGGHLLFRFLGKFPGVAGGTILQFLVPAALATYFVFQRQLQGTAFCLIFLFEQCLPTARYMADARAQELPLLTVGDADHVIHDWNYLFSRFGVLNLDVQIANFVWIIGWAGMIATVAWMGWRGFSRMEISGRAQ
jgi:hypothetical protein